MCSIIGYYGDDLAAPILVKSLKRMEYRGYDSVGVATKYDNKIEILIKVRESPTLQLMVNNLEWYKAPMDNGMHTLQT